MAKKRNISLLIPGTLLEQIRRRALVREVSFNVEMRELIRFAIDNEFGQNKPLLIPEDNLIRTVVFLDGDDEVVIRDRARTYQRSVGKELVRAFAFALEEITERDLALISSLLARQSRQAPAA